MNTRKNTGSPLLARWESNLLAQVRGPKGWASRTLPSRIRFAVLLSVEMLILGSAVGFGLTKILAPTLGWSIAGGGSLLTLAYLWGLALRPEATVRFVVQRFGILLAALLVLVVACVVVAVNAQ